MSKIVRALTWLVVVICIGGFAVLVQSGITSPTLPYSGTVPYAVGRVTRPNDAGDLQPQDSIVEVNGYPFFTCIYLGGFTPIYSAPRNQGIKITYWRPDSPGFSHGQLHDTTIVLRAAGPEQIWGRVSNYVVGAVLLAVGVFFLIFRWPQLRLLAVTSMLGGLLVASVPETAQFVAPYGSVYWVGLPLWAAAATVALADWPLNQLKFRVPRFLIGVITVIALTSIVTNVAGWLGASCAIPSMKNLALIPFGRDLYMATGLLYTIRLVSSLAVTLLPPFCLSYLLLSAYRHTTNRFVRTQIRTLAWVQAIVWFLQALFGPILVLFGVSAPSVAPTLLTAISLIQPVTWAVVAHGSTVIGVERFLNRTVFALLLILTSVVIMFTAYHALFSWIPNPDSVLITVVAVGPILLFATLLRRPFEKVVDIALYGHYYDYEETVTLLMQELSAVPDSRSLGRVLTRNLPQALLVESAAFWTRTPEDSLALVETYQVSAEEVPPYLLESQLGCQEGAAVTVHGEPFQLNGHKPVWHITVKLVSGSTLEGVLLIGPKLRERYYSEKDTRVLLSLANWIGGRLSSWRLTEIELRHEREQTLLLIEHEAAIRGQVAQELHDRGITAVGLIKYLVERGQSGNVVLAALQQVIDDLRLLTSTHLHPSGLDYGLASGLAVLAREYRQLGANIELDLMTSEGSSVWQRLSDVHSRELFYIVHEAVTNAFKADNKAHIIVSVADDGNCLFVFVQDRGPGFDTAQASSVLHHGLSIMQARASRIGANLTIESRKGAGATISISLPLLAEPDPALEELTIVPNRNAES